jgi:hypothetical protein
MSRLWNAYEDAVATFVAAGRLVEYDDSGAVVTVNGEERFLEPATLVTAAMMMVKNGVVANLDTSHSSGDIDRVIVEERMSQEANEENLDAQPATMENVVANVYTSHSSRDIEGALEEGIGDELDPEVAEKLAELERAREEARHICTTHAHLLGYEIAAGYEVTGCQHCTPETLTLEEARAVCKPHADQLAGTVWEEVFCPVCEASNTASGELTTNERRHAMNFHDCHVLDRKNLFAGPDGYCRHCRSVELAAQILDREEVTGPTFPELLDQVGGEEAYRASLEDIRHAKHNGRPGNSVSGRVPRELLNLILTQHPTFINDLLDEYRAFAGEYGIALRHDPDGVLFHDYAVLAPVQPAFPALNGNDLRSHAWQANVAEKRLMRNAFVESVRTSRQIVMRWVSSDGTESGVCALGPNTEETRLIASEYQAAARKKGFRTRFSLVQG